MKEYYQQRLFWIFHYTSKNFGYCLAKTLCLIVGVPIYAVCFLMEMVLTFVNMIFCWIPVLNVVVTVICKLLITLFGSTFYICILTDLSNYKKATSESVQYDISDADQSTEMSKPNATETEDTDATTESEGTED